MTQYRIFSDTELAVLVKEGDVNAFEEIYKRFYGLLYVHALKRLHDEDEVKDLLQDFFASFWHNRGKLEIKAQLSSYLYASVRYKVINSMLYKKNAEKYLASLQRFLEEDHIQADHLIREKDLARLIESEIAALPPGMRHIFELSRFEHLSHKEIAQKLELSEHTVRTQVKKALRILRSKLGLMAYLAFLIKY